MLTVAIVGKPNVGKSTLFNRLVQKRKAIIDDKAGVTRDRIYDYGSWLTREFEVIDTGGLSLAKDKFQANINLQVDFAVDEAQVIIFVVSYTNGIDQDDFLVAKKLKKVCKDKRVILAVNKSESSRACEKMNEFYKLGFGEPIFISAEHGIGVGDLLDKIVIGIPPASENKVAPGFRFCIIGKPNVGKSSLVNAILNKERVIVSDVAGTTRDAIDTPFKYHGEEYVITDTAGIRRKGKVQESVEKYSVMRAEKAIRNAQMILLELDGSTEFSEQDEVIGGLAYKANIPTIIVVNKWDLVQKDSYTMAQYEKMIRARFKYLAWAPIVFLSAKEHKRIDTLFETMNEIRAMVTTHVNTGLLNDVITKAQMLHQAPIHKGQRCIISYATQVESQIPTFVIFCNSPKYLHFSWARYIENEIRNAFGLTKVPVTLYWKDKNAKTRNRSK